MSIARLSLDANNTQSKDTPQLLKTLHKQVSDGTTDPDIPFSPAEYAARWLEYHQTVIRRGIDDSDTRLDEQLE